MANLQQIASEALAKVKKGTTTKEAADVVRRALSMKSNGMWAIRQRPDHPNIWYVTRASDGVSFDIFTSLGQPNGLAVTPFNK